MVDVVEVVEVVVVVVDVDVLLLLLWIRELHFSKVCFLSINGFLITNMWNNL